jgi:hypothetical protein
VRWGSCALSAIRPISATCACRRLFTVCRGLFADWDDKAARVVMTRFDLPLNKAHENLQPRHADRA